MAGEASNRDPGCGCCGAAGDESHRLPHSASPEARRAWGASGVGDFLTGCPCISACPPGCERSSSSENFDAGHRPTAKKW